MNFHITIAYFCLIWNLLKSEELKLYYKVINGLNDLNPSDFFVFAPNLSLSTRGHSLKLVKRSCNTNSLNNCFSNRVINCWNSLPNDVVNASSVMVFKYKLNRLNVSAFS